MVHTPPREGLLRGYGASGAAPEQNRLLLVQFKAAYALYRKLQHLECGAFQVEKLAAFLAHEVHFLLALARASVAVLEFLVLFGPDNLDDTRFFEAGEGPVDGAQRNGGQVLGYIGGLENPVWILDHEVHDDLSRFCLVF